jgi:hypothetical protein
MDIEDFKLQIDFLKSFEGVDNFYNNIPTNFDYIYFFFGL